jgi:hypothetical protein
MFAAHQSGRFRICLIVQQVLLEQGCNQTVQNCCEMDVGVAWVTAACSAGSPLLDFRQKHPAMVGYKCLCFCFLLPVGTPPAVARVRVLCVLMRSRSCKLEREEPGTIRRKTHCRRTELPVFIFSLQPCASTKCGWPDVKS